jgi:hypothetical protein
MSEPLSQIICGEFTMTLSELYEVEKRIDFEEDEDARWWLYNPYVVVGILFVVNVGVTLWNSRSAPIEPIILIDRIFGRIFTLYTVLLIAILTSKPKRKDSQHSSVVCAFEFHPQEFIIKSIDHEQTVITKLPHPEIDEVHDYPDNLLIKASPHGVFLIRKEVLTKQEVEVLRSFFNQRFRKRFYTRRPI